MPRCSVSISPTNCRAAATGVRKRRVLIDLIFATVESYAPNFRASVVGHSALSPLDLEEKLGLAGGDIFHGALGLDQLWAARPMLGYGDYRTPLKSLYLCGSGAHPGGGVTGIPGHNAAREIMRDGCQVLLADLIADNLAIVATGRHETNFSCKQLANLLQLRPPNRRLPSLRSHSMRVDGEADLLNHQ